MRSGDEPTTARSALRLRLGLAIFGAAAAATAAVVLGILSDTALAVVFGVVAAIAFVNVVVVAVRIRQGPSFQPGRDVRPFEAESPPRHRRGPHRLARLPRKRAYFVMVSVGAVLLVLAWTVIYRYSDAAALAMSAAALGIPLFAAIVANAGSADRP